MKRKADRHKQIQEIFGAQEVKKGFIDTDGSMGTYRTEDYEAVGFF